MFSEKIQYNAPVPGEEFRKRDLSVPAEAAHVIYEIDSQHGEDKDLCLTILSRTFRGMDSVSQILHACAQKLQDLGTSTTAWRFHATVSRNIRVATIESRMAAIADGLKELKADVRSASKRKDKLIRTFPTDANGVPRTPAPAQTPAQTPAAARNLEADFEEEEEKGGYVFSRKEISKFRKVEGRLESVESKVREEEKELAELVKEISSYRADPKNARFSRKEETEAKAQVVVQQKEGEGVEGWEKWIERILAAVLKTSDQTIRRKMDAIAMGAIEAPARGSSSLIEFTSEIDKAMKFATWQARIFLKGEALAEVLTRYELTAFAHFKKGLKLVETASWNFVDDEEVNPLKKVLTRLRSGVPVAQAAVPALAIKAVKKQAVAEFGEEEEDEEALGPPRKKGGKGGSVAVVEADPVVVALIGKIDTLVSSMGKTQVVPFVHPERKDNFSQGEGNFSGGGGNFSGGGSNFQRNRGNFSGGGGNFQRNRNNFQARGNNFNGGQGNFNGSLGNFSGNQGNFSGGQSNFNGNQGNFNGNQGNFGGGQGNFSGGGVTFLGGQGNFSSGGGNFQGGGNFSSGFVSSAPQPQPSTVPRLGYVAPVSAANAAPQQGECRYRTCSDPGCARVHRPGQYRPDQARMERGKLFTQAQRCVSFHDKEQCNFPRCARAHGKSSGQGGRCPYVFTGMCDAFFSPQGCQKTHR